MDVVLLSLCSAALFGGMTVALRPALLRGGDSYVGALATVVPAFLIAALAALVRGDWEIAGVWPFLLAGLVAPGLSQVLFTLAVREAGPSRASATVGMAPLFSVTFAVVLLDEPLVVGIALGALLIVSGGLILATEGGRPEHVRTVGLVFALSCALAFAARDTLVRWLSFDTAVTPELAIAATLLGGSVAILCIVLVASRRPVATAGWHLFLPAGVMFGLSCISLYEAFYRGRVSIVVPLVATECLWGIGLSALFLRHVEGVGRRLALGACFVVVGGILIGLSR